MRPGFGSGLPVEINLNMFVNSMGPVDEQSQVRQRNVLAAYVVANIDATFPLTELHL